MAQNKSILHVVCTFPPYSSGMGFSALKQAKLGQKMGHFITVMTPNYDKNKDLLDSVDNMKVIRKKPLFTVGKAGFINTSKIISDNDIIHIHYPFYFSVLPTILSAKLKKKKILLYWHMNPKDSGLKGSFFEFCEKFILPIILKLSDKILVSTYDYFENGASAKSFIKFKNKIQELPFSVDINKFQPREKDPNLVLEHKLENKKILLFVGGLDKGHYFKGVDILLNAFSKLNQSEYKLIIIGDGDLKEDYKNLAKKLNINSNIIFLDNIKNDKLSTYYNLADALILPSINQGEAFGIVQIEAMASGVPVIVSNLPGVRKVLEDGITGFIFENKNIDDLKFKIENLFKNEEKYKQMKINSRKRVEEKFSEKIIQEKLQNIYENLFN